MGSDPGSARLHTASLRVSRPLPGTPAFEAELFGLSTQPTDYQREMAERLRLQFEILSDAALTLVNALKLPTFAAGGMRLIKRLTLIIRGGRIETVFYPVFPSYESAARVIAWLERHPL
jgi:peroxiredoxin